MSKYVLFFILLISLTTSAQEVTSVKTQLSLQNNTWDEQEPFVNGFARVLKNRKFSFINKAGNLISPLEYDGARNFSNHLAAVKKGDKWGFINESGAVIIPFQYDIAFDFTETVTGVFGNKRWWLINNQAAIVKALDITGFYGFKNGIAKINKNNRAGAINTNGEIVFYKGQYDAVQNNPATNQSNPSPVNNAISICPDNIDFEYGSFLNWKCYTGQVDSVGPTNVITVTPSASTPNRHTLYNRVMPSAIDPFGLFPTNPPDGSNFALRLGNTVIGAEAERVRYTIKVPALDSNFSIKYDYAVVFEDPGHTIWTQPRFQVNVFDSAANAYVDCASFEYISTSNLPGFTQSTVDPGVMFKPWSTVFLSLRGYAGKTMYLEFTTADCVRRGHWGYAYVDVEKPCGQAVEMQYDCTAPNATTLTGPPGFQTYNWWDQTFGTLLGTGQQIILNPGPAINTTIWLEMIPYSNFGCLDTIPVKITGEFTADFSMSDTNAVCAPHTFTFYNSHLPSLSAVWDFGDGTTGTGDTVTHTYALPGNYLVKLNVALAGGCNGSAVKLVFIAQPAGSFSFAGGSYCNSQTVQFDAITSYADSLFWDFGDGTLLNTTQTTVTHTYNTPGTFVPSLIIKSLGGCQTPIPATDTIRIDKIDAGFINNEMKVCGGTTLNFTDTSSAYFGIATRIWDFGDGSVAIGNTNVTHTYTATGTYNVSLILTGTSGCPDTETKPIYVKVNDIPVATIDADTAACQSAPVTFNSVIQSVDPITYYRWTSSNGFSGTASSFTLTFNTAGTYTVQLIAATVNGCADTTTHTITINPTPGVAQPPGQALCSGDFTSAINFTGSIPGTIFTWTNTAPIIGLAASGTGNIASFQASSNGSSVANAGITVRPAANGCPGPTKVFIITVYPTPAVVQPANQALCNNGNTTAIAFTGAVAGVTYNWTNNNTAIGLAASGTGNIPSFTATSNGVNTAVATITVTPTINGCPGAAKTFTITVKPTPEIVQPADQLLCSGNFTAAINFSSPVAGTIFTWTNTAPSIGLAVSGTGNIASFQASSNGANITTAAITVNASSNSCAAAPKTFIITVKPTPDVVKPADQTLCNNSNTTAITFTGTVAGTVYNWTNSNPAIGLAASGSGNIPSFTVNSNGANTATATITVTPTVNGCPGASKTVVLTVHPTPDVIQPADQTLCSNNNTAVINFTGAVPGTTYNWINNNSSIGLAASGSGNIPSFIASSNATSTAVATITVTPTVNGCPGSSKVFVITVHPTPDVVQPTDQILCDNSNTTAINFSGAVNGTAYNWTNNNPSIGLAASGSGNIPSFIAASNGATITVATITVTPTVNGCPGTPKTFKITVNPMPAVVQPPNQNLCAGSFTSAINFSGPVAGTIYTWTNTAPSIGLAASGTGNITSFMALTNGTNISSASITVQPAANGCTAPPKTFIITVTPMADVAQPVNQAVCNGATISAVSFTGSVAGTTYNWTNNNPSIGLAASGTGDISSFVAVNHTSSPITATVTVTPAATSCAGPAKIFNITIHPTPVVTANNNATVCLGSTVQLSASGAAQYSWSPATDLSCSNCATPIAKPVDTIIYKVRGTNSFGCEAFDTVLLNVIKPFKMQVLPGDTLCFGESLKLNALKANSYLWSPPAGLNRTNIADPTAKPAVTTQYRVIGFDGHNCFTDTGYVFVAVGPRPHVNLGPDRTLSTGTAITLNAVADNGPIIRWAWTPAAELSCNNCPSPTAIVKNNSFYSVEVTNTFGCTDVDTIFINSFCKSAQVFIPNAFTPDGDGLNDVLMVRGKGVTIKSFRIFNRWGELVFEKENFYPNDLKYGWDGKVRGVPATPDVFVYTAEVFCDNGVVYTYKGNTTILK